MGIEHFLGRKWPRSRVVTLPETDVTKFDDNSLFSRLNKRSQKIKDKLNDAECKTYKEARIMLCLSDTALGSGKRCNDMIENTHKVLFEEVKKRLNNQEARNLSTEIVRLVSGRIRSRLLFLLS